MTDKLRVFIGYDPREKLAYDVCRYSILSRVPKTTNLEVFPVIRDILKTARIYTRESDPGASTEFSLTRFLVPYISGYRGYSVFTDLDFLFTVDITTVMDEVDPEMAVSVVKHPEYTSKAKVKMDGQKQSTYPRKNWSSFAVFNNEKCRRLTPEYVSTAMPRVLHRFEWVDDKGIGSLDPSWNHLVGEHEMPSETPKGIHWTLGFPALKGYENSDYSPLWFAEKRKMEQSTYN